MIKFSKIFDFHNLILELEKFWECQISRRIKIIVRANIYETIGSMITDKHRTMC